MSKISLAHGSGGKLSHQLIRELFLQKFNNKTLAQLGDSAVVEAKGARLAFTTDSFVVKPLFFPGGDIGKLAVYGTVNDLAVMGARPCFISCSFILEEGLEYSILEKIADSMQEASGRAGVRLVTGDTKVVEKDSADGMFINTSGIGIFEKDVELSVDKIKVGDKVLINGAIGEHGISVLSKRDGFDFDSEVRSDCAPLNDLISQILDTSSKIKFMRDPTRGGLATTLNEIVNGNGFGIALEDEKLPIGEDVKGICEILGFDPLYIANEGKVVIVVAREDAQLVLQQMRKHALGRESRIVGEVVQEPKGRVYLQTQVGGTRVVDMLTADQLPRIC